MKKPISWFNISWTSGMDGPGTRVVLYLSGCRLRCPWCHSPHSWTQDPQLMFFDQRCLKCGECCKACPNNAHEITKDRHHIDRSRCAGCGECVKACPTVAADGCLSGALALAPSSTLPEKLFDRLTAQLDLLKPIGGLTVCGGEPLLQYNPLKVLLQKCRQSGYHTAVETSGSVPAGSIRELLGLVDCWLFGLRPIFPISHQKTATADTKTAAANLHFLAGSGKGRVIVRTPIIPGYTNNRRTVRAVADLMAECALDEIELLPFNPHSRLYYDALGIETPRVCKLRLANDDLEKARKYFEGRGMETRVI